MSRASKTSSGISPPPSSQLSELIDAIDNDIAREAMDKFFGRDWIDIADNSREPMPVRLMSRRRNDVGGDIIISPDGCHSSCGT